MFCVVCSKDNCPDWIWKGNAMVCTTCASEIHQTYMTHIVQSTKVHPAAVRKCVQCNNNLGTGTKIVKDQAYCASCSRKITADLTKKFIP